MNAPSPEDGHPLAYDLVRLYRADGGAKPVIEVHAGSGRNTHVLTRAGLPVVTTRDDEPYTQLPGARGAYGGALSTHGYLHGAVAKLRAGIAELRRVLEPGSPVALTLGSISDARYGFGTPLDEHTFAPGDGEEAGIPHAFLDRDGVYEVLGRSFRIETLGEVAADDIVGHWAHENPRGIVHWFVTARAV